MVKPTGKGGGALNAPTNKSNGSKPPWGYPVTVGIAFRMLVNVASPSHELATGEYTEHKKAPIYYGGRLYLDVPIISGNALRRYVKEALITAADRYGLPLGNLCRKGIFTHWNTRQDVKDDVGIGGEGGDGNDAVEINVNNVGDLLKKCVMEDVAGFMYAEGGASIVRFSRLHVATMRPTYESLAHAKVYPIQFARHDPRRGTSGGKSEQMVFRVEHISGEFAGLMTFDAHLLGFDDYSQRYFVDNIPGDVISRAEAVLEAAYLALKRFGAMKARSMVAGDVTSLVITVAKGLFTPADPARPNYVEETEEEAAAYKELTDWDVSIFKYPSEECGNLAEAFKKAKESLDTVLTGALGKGTEGNEAAERG